MLCYVNAGIMETRFKFKWISLGMNTKVYIKLSRGPFYRWSLVANLRS